MKIRILSILLLLSICIPLAACNKAPTDDVPEETTTEASPNVTTEPLMHVPLTENGSTPYKLVSRKNIGEGEIDALLSLHSELISISGVSFPRSGDDIYDGVDYSAKYEIIFGAANRDECREVYSSIGYDGYAVKLVGNKIVLAAYSEEGMKLAAEAFFKECVKTEQNGERTELYYVKDYVHMGEQPLFFTKDNPLSEYKIVYSTSSVGVAGRLAMAIEEKLGITLKMIKDTSPEEEFEILVGTTSRAESQMTEPERITDYVVKAVGKKLVLKSSNGNNSYELASTFARDFLALAPIFNLPADANESNIRYFGENRVSLTEGADIRIMSFNILNEAWATNKDPTPRIPGVIGCIDEYKPDVIGIQEVSPNWYKVIREHLGDDYVFVNSKILGKEDNNYTALAYNKNTVKLLFERIHFYSVGNNQRLRNLNMGMFEHLETGELFIVTNTHYNANHTTVEAEEQNRLIQATEFVQKIEEYARIHKCPIFMTGDYNTSEPKVPYQKMFESGLILSSKYTAREKGLRANQNSIDHILYTGNATPLYFTFLEDSCVVNASDHLPLYADFKFESKK